MDIYIVDANLIFSGILNLKSGIAQFILNADQYDVQLHAPEQLKITKEILLKQVACRYPRLDMLEINCTLLLSL
ncbi:MAG: hypothetical protein AAGI23_00125 [Bacteroidota bacterium]